jgi:hypothetical protein
MGLLRVGLDTLQFAENAGGSGVKEKLDRILKT